MKLELLSVMDLFLTVHVLVVVLQLVCGLVFTLSRRCSELFVWCSRWSCLAEWAERENHI